MVEYWNVDLTMKVTHLLPHCQEEFCQYFTLSKTSSPIVAFSLLHVAQDKIPHYSIIPVFQYSNCERSELSSPSCIQTAAIYKRHCEHFVAQHKIGDAIPGPDPWPRPGMARCGDAK